MLKLLSITVLASSVLAASGVDEQIEEFLIGKFSENKRIESVDVNVKSSVDVQNLKGWKGYIVEVDATLKGKKDQHVKEKMIWFSNGKVITKEFVDMESGKSLVDLIKPKIQAKHYAKENLIYGNANAKHKVVFFSDPLCPFCKRLVPEALKTLKKDPNKFAVYYYHLPLERIHPASVEIVKMAAAAEMQGIKDVTLKMYDIKVDPREKDTAKILEAFNKAVGSKLTLKDINNLKVAGHIKHDMDVANELMVRGTPTVYFDGEFDETKEKYKKVK